MDELTIGDKVYISSKRAAKITGYAKDYVGQLCREGRVEARLVGRNWYVLEGAIRAHRFGAEEKNEETRQEEASEAPKSTSTSEISLDSTWSSPSYKPEEPVIMPKLSDTAPSLGSVAAHDEQVVADMQAAWKDWFKSDQKSLPEGDDMGSVTTLSESESISVSQTSAPVTEEDVAVHISRLENTPEASVEAYDEQDVVEEVSLHRSYTDQQHGEVVPATHDVVDLTRSRREVETPVEEFEEGVIIREKRHKVRVKREAGLGTAVLRAFLCAVALLVVLVGLIGSGYADAMLRGFSGYGFDKNFIIQYLEGARTFEK